jgi:hypothetical protein
MTIDEAVRKLTELRDQLGGDAPVVLYNDEPAEFGQSDRDGVVITSDDDEAEGRRSCEATLRWRLRRQGIDATHMQPPDLEEVALRDKSPALAQQLRQDGAAAGLSLEVVRFTASEKGQKPLRSSPTSCRTRTGSSP